MPISHHSPLMSNSSNGHKLLIKASNNTTASSTPNAMFAMSPLGFGLEMSRRFRNGHLQKKTMRRDEMGRHKIRKGTIESFGKTLSLF